jgi:hypothetical protein
MVVWQNWNTSAGETAIGIGLLTFASDSGQSNDFMPFLSGIKVNSGSNTLKLFGTPKCNISQVILTMATVCMTLSSTAEATLLFNYAFLYLFSRF